MVVWVVIKVFQSGRFVLPEMAALDHAKSRDVGLPPLKVHSSVLTEM